MKEPTEHDSTLLLFLGIYSAGMITLIVVATSWFFATEPGPSLAGY